MDPPTSYVNKIFSIENRKLDFSPKKSILSKNGSFLNFRKFAITMADSRRRPVVAATGNTWQSGNGAKKFPSFPRLIRSDENVSLFREKCIVIPTKVCRYSDKIFSYIVGITGFQKMSK